MKRTACCVLLVAAAASASARGASPAQTLRTCVDRWNQGRMIHWNSARANIAFRLPVARERSSIVLPKRRQCIVAYGTGEGTWTCVLVETGAYWCPPKHASTGPPLTRLHANATIDRRGHLALDVPLRGTHPTPRLRWMRYPHYDGTVEPWTADGKLRPGLTFKGKGRGRCFLVSETLPGALSCLTPTMGRYEACFPQHRPYRRGTIAACAGLGTTTFVRWTITGR